MSVTQTDVIIVQQIIWSETYVVGNRRTKNVNLLPLIKKINNDINKKFNGFNFQINFKTKNITIY